MPLSNLQQALLDGIKPGVDLAAALEPFGDSPVSTAEDAQAIVDAVKALRLEHYAVEKQPGVFNLVSLFQRIQTREAYTVLMRDGLNLLRAIYTGKQANDDLKMF